MRMRRKLKKVSVRILRQNKSNEKKMRQMHVLRVLPHFYERR